MKKRARGKGEGTNEVDVAVGRRLRELRMLAGLSQGDLAATIGLTFQQLQKYERGVNRISASKLYLLARHLNIPVSIFFADLDGQQGVAVESFEPANALPLIGAEVVAPSHGDDPVGRSREALILSRNFQRIGDAEKKNAIRAFVEACAGIPSNDGVAATEEKSGERGDGGLRGGGDAPKKPRRPRGATWHPTDISRR